MHCCVDFISVFSSYPLCKYWNAAIFPSPGSTSFGSGSLTKDATTMSLWLSSLLNLTCKLLTSLLSRQEQNSVHSRHSFEESAMASWSNNLRPCTTALHLCEISHHSSANPMTSQCWNCADFHFLSARLLVKTLLPNTAE